MATSKNRQRLGYRRIVQLLVYLVIIPSGLMLSLGIVSMIIGQAGFDLMMGILIVSFVAAVITGVVLVMFFVRREANLAELQADFVSKVSHELRTPLTAIRLFAETLERSKDDPATQAQCIRMLSTESEKLSERIERLLDWGRMEAGRKQYDIHPVPVEEAVRAAVEAFTPIRTDESLQLVTEIAPDLPLVLVDRGALVDTLVNLLSNAHKYGGAPAKVAIAAKLNENGRVAITVTDNGAGIPARERRRIFEKFYRIDDRLPRAREGSGLGLAIVKHFARAHGAKISVESAPEDGKGSTFRLVLRVSQGGEKLSPSDAAEGTARPNEGVALHAKEP
ncbi:hypothetical protein BH09MYX1_BH09MYX1_38200 [soil metagenome]